VRVRAPKLAEAFAEVRCAVLRIAASATVANPDVEEPVRPDLHLPAVVVRIRLLDEQQQPCAVEEGVPAA
jgi:hypothetical protein